MRSGYGRWTRLGRDETVRSVPQVGSTRAVASQATVDLLASSIDRGARRRGGARATAPLPTTGARGVAGAGSDDPSSSATSSSATPVRAAPAY